MRVGLLSLSRIVTNRPIEPTLAARRPIESTVAPYSFTFMRIRTITRYVLKCMFSSAPLNAHFLNYLVYYFRELRPPINYLFVSCKLHDLP